jgi:hypothetical protein
MYWAQSLELKRPLSIGAILLVLLSFALACYDIIGDPNSFQWDMKVYFRSPVMWSQGLDPYGPGGEFVYLPLFLPLFKVFSLFPYNEFHLLYLTVKILAFAGLLTIWKQVFLKETKLAVFALAVWLGFYATVLVDFHAGNISVFEDLLLFAGFAFFVQGSLWLFVLFTVIAANFKLMPIAFLILLPLSRAKDWQKYLALGLAAFVGFIAANFLIFPEMTKRLFLEAFIRTNESGVISSSLLAVIQDFMREGLEVFHYSPPTWQFWSIYLLLAVAIFLASLKLWQTSAKRWNTMELTLFSILVYTLTVPRVKDYQFMLAIPSVLYAIEKFDLKIPRWVWLFPILVLGPGTIPPLFETVHKVFQNHLPYFVVLFFWQVYRRHLSDPVSRYEKV